ncbi:MAG: Ppx/GppA family phosphatase [Thermoplasmatales archaeon]|jgi:exopolyphosphatase/guanosine-5'-triphosphate,3'-diphosphate pyrophosphatase|nr:Ppx/GppA family phosphatase [Thermoplasmatales archaeon]
MDEPETVGFIDVGTNSVHLLVVEFHNDSMGTPIYQDKEVVRLGESLYRDGRLDKAAIDKCSLVVSKFSQMSRGLGASKVYAYGTCACREADNRNELLEAIRKEGLDVRVIPGLEEARLISLGVFGPTGPRERTLEIDIGGGSTEIILRQGEENLFLDSLDMGAVRYSYGLGVDTTVPVSDRDYDALRRHVDLASFRAVRAVRDLGFDRAVGSSGTMINLAEMCAARRGGDSSYFTHDELVKLMSEILPMTSQQRADIPKINRNRVDIIVAGGAIAEELMHLFGIERIEISERGLKQGMHIEYLLRRGYTNFDVKESSVRGLANRCQYDRGHAERVRELSLALFDGMRELGLHRMGDDLRGLLGYAALLHDIGEFISYTKHHVHSYTIILNSYMLGFDYRELRAMALMAKFHHKKFPNRYDRLFRDLEEAETDDILRCAMILKTANVMDRHRNGAVKEIRLSVSLGDLVVEIVPQEGTDVSMEIWRLGAMSEEFSAVFELCLSPVLEVGRSF